jgi:group II intron reverse transcriptase/maturase
MGDTLRSQTISTKLEQIAEQARAYPDMTFTTLAHLIDVEFLGVAFQQLRKDAAPGVDGTTAEKYAENLGENLRDLHERMRSGRYKATPVKRIWLDKDDGRKRPIGITALEDKIAERAVAMILVAIYEEEFYDFSYGFRPGRNPHQALSVLRERCMGMNGGWIIDVDVQSYFDKIPHGKLVEVLKKRVNDGGIIRLIGKWLNAGVMEEGTLSHAEEGAPQGGVISPVLSNVYLHEVMDKWFVEVVRPRLKGQAYLIRFADDAIILCELEEDARRLMQVLPKRFERYGLTIHPKKTKLVRFEKPSKNDSGTGNGTFDFLGFTHYWAKSRRGYWVVKRKTIAKRMRRAMNEFWQWCRWNRHVLITEQYKKLCQKLRGYYQYYAIRGNYPALEKVYSFVVRAWRYWLRRRDRKKQLSWEKYEKVQEMFPLPRPRIIHAI